jgi:hypothetical protein
MKVVYLDAEYNRTQESRLNLVSIAFACYIDGAHQSSECFWLYGHDDNMTDSHLTAEEDARKAFTDFYNEGYIFAAYNVASETRALRALLPNIDWVSARWIDIYLEYRCLLNGNNTLAYGKQLIRGKEVVTTPPPNKWDMFEDEDEDGIHSKPEYSLAAATYKLLGKKIDTDRKTHIRDIIISDKNVFENKGEIVLYNLDDISNLRDVLLAVVKEYLNLGVNRNLFFHYAFIKGRFGALTGVMEDVGYPVNIDKIKSFVKHIPEILESTREDCENYLPGCFVKGKLVEKVIRDWVSKQNLPRWRQTSTGKLSISKDAFNEWYDSQSEGFGGAFCRYLKTKQSLNGFLPGSRKNFFDSVGSDGRVRPYLGIYGSQTSRSQPSSSAFIPLKSHWMRNFIEARDGYALVEIDYSSQEFLIAAIVSQDQAMMEAYASGDVYLAFAKACGMAPKDATKTSHKKERDDCKAAVLGMSYEMGAKSLAAKLTKDTGRNCTEETAQDFIDLFAESYPEYATWKYQTLKDYKDNGSISLPDGWTMWGDNENRRSILNMPIQGSGAQIMREAVYLCYKNGIKVVMTLHDAVFAEVDYFDLNKMRLFNKIMINAFHNVMKEYGEAPEIRTEGMAWSKSYANFPLKKFDNIELFSEYITPKCVKDLERFKRYFT